MCLSWPSLMASIAGLYSFGAGARGGRGGGDDHGGDGHGDRNSGGFRFGLFKQKNKFSTANNTSAQDGFQSVLIADIIPPARNFSSLFISLARSHHWKSILSNGDLICYTDFSFHHSWEVFFAARSTFCCYISAPIFIANSCIIAKHKRYANGLKWICWVTLWVGLTFEDHGWAGAGLVWLWLQRGDPPHRHHRHLRASRRGGPPHPGQGPVSVIGVVYCGSSLLEWSSSVLWLKCTRAQVYWSLSVLWLKRSSVLEFKCTEPPA